jgi:hypothetical protein
MKLAAKFLPPLLASATLVAAPDFPPLVFPEGVGVNIHFTRGHERDLDMIRDGGFKFIRMDFGWGGIERKKGEYDWAAYDELTANLEKRGLRAIYILDYSNGLYEEAITTKSPLDGREHRDTASPARPESVAAFARWAAAAAARFKGRRIIWEIWNEPNIGFWKPRPNAKDYATLVLATCKAMRAADPQATIVAPASSGFPWPFFEELFKAGALEFLDAVSVHPYRGYSQGPETAADDYLRLRTMIERHAPPEKRNMPVLSGEWGYATHNKGVSLETQAAFIARQQIANVWQRVPVSIWYDWKNDGDDPAYNEHNFGTVSNNLALKPGYLAVRTLTRELAGFHIARRLTTGAQKFEAGSEEDFVFLLVNATGRQKLVAWTAAQPHELSLTLDLSGDNDVVAVNGQGHPLAVKVEQGSLRLNLDAAPQYITLKKPSLTLKAAAAWSVDGPAPVRITGGSGPEEVQTKVWINVTNPFPVTVIARMKVRSPYGRVDWEPLLEPGQVMRWSFPIYTLRSPEAGSWQARVQFSEVKGESGLYSDSREVRQFLVANPLTLAIAPVEEGVRVLIRNPDGGSLTGTAVVNGRRFPVQLGEQPSEAVIVAPATEGVTSVQLREGKALPGIEDRVVTEEVSRRFSRIAIPGLRNLLDGDAKVRATASVIETNAPGPQPPFAKAYRVDYQFDAGWKFARCVMKSDKPLTLAGQPTALGLWVHGDNSGNALHTRVTDAGGQTFQPNGPSLDWTGWRWVEFDLKNLSKAGHWGGANDGVVHGGLRLDTLLLIDGSRKKTGGTVFFAGPVAIE